MAATINRWSKELRVPFVDFTGLAIVSLIMGFVALRTLVQVIRDRKTLFDDNFTRADRQQMSVAAFLLLIPVSVFFHEVGHAVAIWWYGGEVTAFGFFFFFGFVGYRGITDVVELFWIALWGNIVSVALGLGALLLAFLRPMRAAINYLLIIFGMISILVSLVFYPMFDFMSDLHGDWTTIYSSETRGHAIGTGIVHGAILLGLIAGWRIERVRLRFAEITGLQPEEMRSIGRKQAEQEILQAARLAADQFEGLARVEAGGSSREAVSARIDWTSGGFGRSVIVIGLIGNRKRVEIYGAMRSLDGENQGGEQRIRAIRGFPEPERVAPQILRALRHVDKSTLVQSDNPHGEAS
jgi:hypothetical protein